MTALDVAYREALITIAERREAWQEAVAACRRIIAGQLPEVTMTAIDERAAQLEAQGKDLGEPLDVERRGPGAWRHRAYQNATLVEIPNAGVYVWPEATVADKFLDAPGE